MWWCTSMRLSTGHRRSLGRGSGIDRVLERAEAVDLDPHHVARPQQLRRLHRDADAAGVPVAITSPGSSVNAVERCSTSA
jgi:hypothetical protein